MPASLIFDNPSGTRQFSVSSLRVHVVYGSFEVLGCLQSCLGFRIRHTLGIPCCAGGVVVAGNRHREHCFETESSDFTWQQSSPITITRGGEEQFKNDDNWQQSVKVPQLNAATFGYTGELWSSPPCKTRKPLAPHCQVSSRSQS